MMYGELLVIHGRARLGGIPSVVRWLRNPVPELTNRVLRRYGATIGIGVTFKGALFFDNVTQDENSAGDFSHLTIGENVYIGDCVYIDLAGRVTIAANALIAARAAVVTHRDVNRSPWLHERMPRICEPVTIESGASLSVSATMLAGSTLARESVLAAGALLGQGRSTEPRTVYGGVPAHRLRGLDD